MKINTLTIALILLAGCKVGVGTNESEQFLVAPITGNIDFQALTTYVLKPGTCLKCHSWVSDEASVQQRIKSGEPENSIIYQKIKSGSMPPSGALSSKQLEVLERYILTAKTAPTIAINSTFKSINFHLIGKSCLACHQDNPPDPDDKDNPSFEGYIKVKRRSKSILNALVTGQTKKGKPMPPFKDDGVTREAPVPSKEVIEAFKQWVAEGMQDN